MEALEKMIELIEVDSKNRSTDLIKTQINKLTKRNKCTKIADKSPGGWETVKDYLTDDLADDSADGRKIRQAEKTALGKLTARGKKFRYLPYTLSENSKNHSSTITKPVVASEVDVPSKDPPSSGTRRHFSQGAITKSTTYRPSYRAPGKSDNQCFGCGKYGHHRRVQISASLNKS